MPWGAWATVAAVAAVTGRAFVTRPGGTAATVGAVTAVTAATAYSLGFAVAAVTTVAVEPRPACALIWWGEGIRCR
jgi:hypothetical protein